MNPLFSSAAASATVAGAFPWWRRSSNSSAIRTISFGPMPTRVTSGVPSRTPPGFFGLRSPGRRFLFAMIPEAASRAATAAPPPSFSTRTASVCDFVNPRLGARTSNPRSCSAWARAWAFSIVRRAYSRPNSRCSARLTASAAIAWRWWLLVTPGKAPLSSFLRSSASSVCARRIPCCGPGSVLCVEAERTVQPSWSGSWNWPPAMRPRTCAASYHPRAPISSSVGRSSSIGIGNRNSESPKRHVLGRTARSTSRVRATSIVIRSSSHG